jgi:hypothetical protein
MVNSEDPLGKSAHSMNIEQVELYRRIQAFSLDKPDARLSFSKRLARDNGWSLEYARQAIEEYKKLAFLAVAAGHPVTPSDQVDQVWHLHLTYTRSYWEEFCSDILQQPLHHDPTLGGETENQKFDDWYGKTLESYKRFFNQTPPLEIWSAPSDRFGRDLYFTRVNTQQNWILPKFQVQKRVMTSIIMLLSLILGGCYRTDSVTIANLSINPYLAFFCLVVAFGIIKFAVDITVYLIKNRSLPPTKGTWGSIGCAGSGCGNWGGGDSGGHSAGDSGGGDGGGCGGGGCGGGGCGG